jgi:hypothetical protein
MPLLHGGEALFGPRRTGPSEITGRNLGTRSLGDWRGDPGILGVKSEDWGSPGAGYSPARTYMAEGPYAGYSRRATLPYRRPAPSLTEAREAPGGRPWGGVGRTSSGFAAGQPAAPTATSPKRLWGYSLGRLAPGNTMLGRMRTLAGGFGSSMF